MEEGAFFLRLTALSPEGLEGKATTYSFIRARNGVGYGDWVHIDGFSEAVLTYIRETEGLVG